MSTVKEEFEYSGNSGTHSIKSQHILCCANTGRVVAVFYNERDLLAATGLSKNIELEHGCAYQFKNIEENTISGIYSEDEHSFTSVSVEWLADSCTNVVKLVPELMESK